MQHSDFDEVLEKIVSRETRYDPNAYHFVREALDHTQQLVAQNRPGEIRHVSGQELLEGVRQFALEQFGPMTKTVLEEWGIRATRDFGEIVFILIEHNVLAKTREDSIDDFNDGYDFETAFVHPFLPASKRAQRERPLKKETQPSAVVQKS